MIHIPASDRETLIRWSNSRTLAHQTVERAKMILSCGEGKPVKQIAEELGTYPNKIIYWDMFQALCNHRSRLIPESTD